MYLASKLHNDVCSYLIKEKLKSMKKELEEMEGQLNLSFSEMKKELEEMEGQLNLFFSEIGYICKYIYLKISRA